MTTPTFDTTLQTTRAMENAGLKRELAEAIAEGIDQAVGRCTQHLATKADLAVMQAEIAIRFESVETRFESVGTRFQSVETRFQSIETQIEKAKNAVLIGVFSTAATSVLIILAGFRWLAA